jgi:hypothetical protein
MRKEHHELPGLPRAKLVREVRRHLRFYGIVPPRDDTTWRMAWQWAHAIALFYWRTRWPLASEIGSQYVLLLLTRIRNDVALKLPFRWDQRMPAIVAERLSNGSPLRIDGPSAGNVDSEKKPKKTRD